MTNEFDYEVSFWAVPVGGKGKIRVEDYPVTVEVEWEEAYSDGGPWAAKYPLATDITVYDPESGEVIPVDAKTVTSLWSVAEDKVQDWWEAYA